MSFSVFRLQPRPRNDVVEARSAGESRKAPNIHPRLLIERKGRHDGQAQEEGEEGEDLIRTSAQVTAARERPGESPAVRLLRVFNASDQTVCTSLKTLKLAALARPLRH